MPDHRVTTATEWVTYRFRRCVRNGLSKFTLIGNGANFWWRNEPWLSWSCLRRNRTKGNLNPESEAEESRNGKILQWQGTCKKRIGVGLLSARSTDSVGVVGFGKMCQREDSGFP